jgi:hydroxymethylglutaryl-CoA synthase
MTPHNCIENNGWVHVKHTGKKQRCNIFDIYIIGNNSDVIVHMKGAMLMRYNQIPPALNLPSSIDISQCSTDVGILAMEYYCPNLCVRATDIEDFHNCKAQYTLGRGQENVTFCSDDEDAVSMAMTALSRLLTRCGLEYSEIGRLEVGTESQVDRAKSIKSFLMALFEEQGIRNIEGTDTYNACYGGTNAFFNATNWVQSKSWNGKYAIVICSDTAVHPDPSHLSAIGASAVAILVGSHAPIVLEPKRATFIKHSWDFYRPIGWQNNDALIDIYIATF